VTVLQCGPAESRSFANWSMAFVGQSDAGRARWDGIAATSGFDLSRLDGDAVFAMLHGLVLDEEGLPLIAGAAQEPLEAAAKLASGLDPERVRAELPQLGLAQQPEHDASLMPAARTVDPQPLGKDISAHTAQPSATVAILRAALVQERQRTTELRDELDEVRIALAVQGEQFDTLRQERDLWAKRAELLATVISHEAHEVIGNSTLKEMDASTSQAQSPSPPSIRIVA